MWDLLIQKVNAAPVVHVKNNLTVSRHRIFGREEKLSRILE